MAPNVPQKLIGADLADGDARPGAEVAGGQIPLPSRSRGRQP